jgi:hypothetical protein
MLLLRNFDQAETLIKGHKFLAIRKLIEDHGALTVAKNFVFPGKILTLHSGLVLLARHDLIHLSVEQAVVDVGVGEHFTEVDVSNARSRMWNVLAETAIFSR